MAERSNRDPDSEYLAGCSVAGIAGFVALIPPIVLCVLDSSGPQTVFTSAGLTSLLLKAAILPVLGCAILSRIARLPAVVGGFGGFFAGAAYWFIHLQQMITKANLTRNPTEYGDSTMFIVPLLWVAIGAAACFAPLLLKKRQNSS